MSGSTARHRSLAAGFALAGLLALALPLVALSLRPLATDDTWWHLAIRLYATGDLWPAEDPLLHTAVSRQPVPHEWLFQIGLHGLHVAAGFQGLRLLHGILVAGILAAAFALFRRASGNLAYAACATAVFASLCWFRLLQLRPDLISIAAALSLYALVLLPEKPDLRRLCAGGLLLMVWVNSHSLFAIGLALLLAAAVGALCAAALARFAGDVEVARDSAKRAGRLALLLVAGGVVTLANPRGFAQHLTFLTEASVGSIWKIRDDFKPWNPLVPIEGLTAFTPFSWALANLLFGSFLAVTLWQAARFLRRRDRASLAALDPVHAALGAAALVASLVAVRFHWLSFLPLLYLLRRGLPGGSRLAPWLAAAATLGLAVAMPRANGWAGFFAEVGREPHGWRAVFMDERYCGPGMRFLADAGLEGRLYQPFNEGGFLGYFLAPRLRTFIDGRLDHVPRRVLDDYLVIRSSSRDGPTGPLRALLDAWKIDVFFADTFPESLYPDRASGFRLRRMPEWLPVYASRNCSIYLRRSPENRENLLRVASYYRGHGVPFDGQRGFDVARARSAAPEWAAVQRIDLAEAERLAAWRRGDDPGLRRAARSLLADHAWRIGDFAGFLAIDEEWLAEEPAAFDPAWRRVDALLMLGRPEQALRAAEALAAAHPERVKSQRWLGRARRAVARDRKPAE